MIDAESSVRLLVGLVALVYGALAVIPGTGERGFWKARGLVMVTASAPLLVWLVRPEFLVVAQFDVSIEARRAALILGAAAIALRYASMRARTRPERIRTALSYASIPLAMLFVAFSTVNWIVAAAGVVAAAATRPRSIAGASSDEDRSQPTRSPEP